jgi:hypothetical protein
MTGPVQSTIEDGPEGRSLIALGLCSAEVAVKSPLSRAAELKVRPRRGMPVGSSIINVSGVVGDVTAGLPQAAYAASKAGLLGSPGYLDRSVDLIPARRPGEAAEIPPSSYFWPRTPPAW